MPQRDEFVDREGAPNVTQHPRRCITILRSPCARNSRRDDRQLAAGSLRRTARAERADAQDHGDVRRRGPMSPAVSPPSGDYLARRFTKIEADVAALAKQQNQFVLDNNSIMRIKV